MNKLLFFPLTPLYRSRDICLDLSNKTVLITGASFGIGNSIARSLSKTKAHLILVARSEDELIALKNDLLSEESSVDIFVCDLYHEDQVKSLIEFLAPFKIDIFISNAGKSIRRSIYDSLDRYSDFDRTIHLNYLAPVEIMLSLIPNLIQNKGHVIDISALNVQFSSAPNWSAYQASKSAFNQWLESVAIELTAKEVAVTSIYLPLVKTRMIQQTASYDNLPAMLPQEVASLVLEAIQSRKRRYQPWWLTLVRIISITFHTPLESLITYLYKKGRI